MKDRTLSFRKNTAIVFFSVVISFLFVALVTYAGTTISTNISTSGTLSVTGASTLTGAVWASSTLQTTNTVIGYGAAVFNESGGANDFRVEGDTVTSLIHVDGTNDRVGIGSSTPAAFFSVGQGAGTVTGDVFMSGGLTVGATSTINSVEGTILLGNTLQDNPTGSAAVEGLIYYNNATNNLMLYNGSAWGLVGTSTGMDLSGSKIFLADITKNFLTLGTTTAQVESLMTLEATSTTAIPLSIVGRASQTGNLLQVMDAGGSNWFIVGPNGTSTITTGALIGGGYTAGSGTGATINSLGTVQMNGNLYINGMATTTSAGVISTEGNLTVLGSITGTSTLTTGAVIGGGYSQGGTGVDINSLGAIWTNGDVAVNGNATTTSAGAITTEGALTVKGAASSTSLVVGGDSVNGTLSGIVSGYCNITASVTITATSTIAATCAAANGIRAGDRVFVNATSSLPATLAVVSASSTAANTIGLYIANINGGADVGTGAISLWFLGIR